VGGADGAGVRRQVDADFQDVMIQAISPTGDRCMVSLW
jgi:hypothetical protein